MIIKTDDMDLVGDVIQVLCQFLNIDDMQVFVDFFDEMEKLRSIFVKVIRFVFWDFYLYVFLISVFFFGVFFVRGDVQFCGVFVFIRLGINFIILVYYYIVENKLIKLNSIFLMKMKLKLNVWIKI